MILFEATRQRMQARASAVLVSLETRLDQILIGWLLFGGLTTAAMIAAKPVAGYPTAAGMLPYVLLVLAPMASAVLALRWFAGAERFPQPEHRLARVGRWRTVGVAEARRHPLFGTSGIMVSLLVGMLLNVPVRAAEFLVTIPPVGVGAPGWLVTLHAAMAFDAVLLTSLYAIAFVAALRKVPLFPRLLVLVWSIDLLMQLVVAQMAAASGLPAAVAAPLGGLLDGNLKKALISMALWLPYLLLSTRVNVTFRSRVPA
jgi:hypothetical protein